MSERCCQDGISQLKNLPKPLARVLVLVRLLVAVMGGRCCQDGTSASTACAREALTLVLGVAATAWLVVEGTVSWRAQQCPPKPTPTPAPRAGWRVGSRSSGGRAA